MVSLAVVVAAILAVLVLVFSDQPATEQVRRLRGWRGVSPVASPAPASGMGADVQPEAPSILRGPPPARVLQRQLALPSARSRTFTPSGPPRPSKPVTMPTLSRPSRAPVVEDVPLPVGDPEAMEPIIVELERTTFLTRVRSSVALLVLLTVVGALVALGIGVVLSLAGLALRHTLG
jgi:hypothetical protein